MSTRLAQGGRFVNRAKAVRFAFNGKNLDGYEGDTLASALLAMRSSGLSLHTTTSKWLDGSTEMYTPIMRCWWPPSWYDVRKSMLSCHSPKEWFEVGSRSVINMYSCEK